MPKKRPRTFSLPPTLALKALALADDPLVQEHRQIYEQLFSPDRPALAQPSRQELHLLQQLGTLAKKISKTYNITFPGWRYSRFGIQKDWASLLAQPFNMHNILRISTNWRSSFSPGPPYKGEVSKDSVNAFARRLSQSPPLPDKPTKGSPPTLTLTLALSQVKRNNLEPLAREFKDAIRQCLDEMPKPHRNPPTMWVQNVVRDYGRFRQHFCQGIPYRWIAVYERTGARPNRLVPGPVPRESSVRESVERVHLILFEKEFTTSRRSHKPTETTLLATTLKQFNCPDHERDCPISCQYAKDFIENIQDIR